MRHPNLHYLLVVAPLLLAACQSGVGVSEPVGDGLPVGDYAIHEVDEKAESVPDIVFTQEGLQQIFANYQTVEMVAETHSYDLRDGDIHSFIPSGYPESAADAERYTCTVRISPTDSMGLPEVDVPITLAIQTFGSWLDGQTAPTPVAKFAFYTTHPGGLRLDTPALVTICRPPSSDFDPATALPIAYFIEKNLDGGEFYSVSDLQYVEIDPVTGAATLSVSYIPDYAPLDKQNETGHWETGEEADSDE